MSAQIETLRQAAKEIRVRANAAATIAPPPWWSAGERFHYSCVGYGATGADVIGHNTHKETSDHIASWDPAAALAVADLLDAGADEIARRVDRDGPEILERANPVFHAMCELARTYLGDDA